MATALTGEPPPDRKHAVSLMRIGPAQCRFIISEPANKPIFCGAPTNGCSWCAWHRGIVYRGGPLIVEACGQSTASSR